MKISGEQTQQSLSEQDRLNQLYFHATSLLHQYGHQWNMHSTVTMRRQTLSRLLYYHELYSKIIEIPGVICEFGVQWGETLTTLMNLRGIYEPYNISRKIIGFDTFEGFPETEGGLAIGDYSTLNGYEKILEEILTLQESFSPLSHIKRFELVKGDVKETLRPWLNENPQTIAMAIFDMDLYIPTRYVLEWIRPRLIPGSLLVFDEFNHPKFPGETQVVREVFGNRVAMRRSPLQPYCSWVVYE